NTHNLVVIPVGILDHLQVTAGRKRPTRPSDYGDTHVRIAVDGLPDLDQLGVQTPVRGVEHVRPVEGQPEDAVLTSLEENVLEIRVVHLFPPMGRPSAPIERTYSTCRGERDRKNRLIISDFRSDCWYGIFSLRCGHASG